MRTCKAHAYICAYRIFPSHCQHKAGKPSNCGRFRCDKRCDKQPGVTRGLCHNGRFRRNVHPDLAAACQGDFSGGPFSYARN